MIPSSLRPFRPALFCLALALPVLPLGAQHHEAVAVEPASHAPEAQPQEAAPTEPHAAPAAHEGEASGHHGPVIKLLGHELSKGAQFLVQLFNFAIFAGILVFALKGILASAFRMRAKELEEKLSQAERDKTEGDARIRDLEAKMQGLEQELDAITARAETEAEAERQRIVAAARTEAEAILLQARADVANQLRLAEQELRGMVAGMAVEGARARLTAALQDARLQGQTTDKAIENLGGVQ